MDNAFTQCEINYIIESYSNQVAVSQIVDALQTEEHNVREILKQYQLDRQYNKWSKELTDSVIAMHKAGYLHKDIRYKLLVSDQGINNVIDRNNIPRISCSQRNRRFDRNSNYFDVIDTEDKAYFFGLLCSDGCNNIEHRQILISLQEEDGYLLEALKDALEYEGKIKTDCRLHKKDPKYKIVKRLAICDIHMSEQLERMGVIKNKSLNFKFPSCVPDELLRHFLRGYFDGDGCIYYDEKREKGATQLVGTKNFCETVSSILSSMGINNNVRHPKQSLDNDTYIVATSATKSSYLFLSWMYEDSQNKMIRKYNRYLRIKEKYQSVYGV